MNKNTFERVIFLGLPNTNTLYVTDCAVVSIIAAKRHISKTFVIQIKKDTSWAVPSGDVRVVEPIR